MSHTLTLAISDDVYTVLTKTARQVGQLPETLAAQWLNVVSQHLSDDPVEQFIGAVRSPMADWADQHDKYIGNVIMETMKNVDYKGDTE